VARPALERFLKLGAGAYFDFDFQVAVRKALQRGAHTARSCYVVVLDEHRVEQTQAMVGDTAGGSGHFLQTPQAGRGLARIQDTAARTLNRVDVSPRQGGHAAQPLQEIERHPLALQQLPRRAAHLGQHIARLQPGAVAAQQRQFRYAPALRVNQIQESDAGEHQRLARDKAPARRRIRAHAGVGGDVARAYVFGQRAPYGIQYFGVLIIQHHDEARSPNAARLLATCVR